MSRSRKKTPKTGITTAESEKDNKRKANRIFRRVTKVQLKNGDSQFVNIKEVSNVWSLSEPLSNGENVSSPLLSSGTIVERFLFDLKRLSVLTH